jgi:hypothetical protein
MTDSNLVVAADGTVRDKDGNIIAGITGSSLPPGYGDDGEIDLQDLLEANLPEFYNIIIGGASEDGVAKSKVVPISPLAQQALDALSEESK